MRDPHLVARLFADRKMEGYMSVHHRTPVLVSRGHVHTTGARDLRRKLVTMSVTAICAVALLFEMVEIIRLH
ncbi:MAG TPA: hypothetical protein VGM20_01315 [Gemmatimonadales bacterium]